MIKQQPKEKSTRSQKNVLWCWKKLPRPRKLWNWCSCGSLTPHQRKEKKLQCYCVDVGDVEVVCDLYHSAAGEGTRAFEVGKTNMLGEWMEYAANTCKCWLRICCKKHWEWQEERNSVMKHGTVVKPTMYQARLDIKTAFDEAKPKHVAKILEGHNSHGWLIAALLRAMSGLPGKATFECVESCFSFNRCLRPP